MTTMSVRFTEEQARALRTLAVAMDKSASAVIRSAMDDYIDKHRTERACERRRGRVGEHAWEIFDLLTT
jgi:predicted transcriptional regulator